jgi:hypothetical protein
MTPGCGSGASYDATSPSTFAGCDEKESSAAGGGLKSKTYTYTKYTSRVYGLPGMLAIYEPPVRLGSWIGSAWDRSGCVDTYPLMRMSRCYLRQYGFIEYNLCRFWIWWLTILW